MPGGRGEGVGLPLAAFHCGGGCGPPVLQTRMVCASARTSLRLRKGQRPLGRVLRCISRHAASIASGLLSEGEREKGMRGGPVSA